MIQHKTQASESIEILFDSVVKSHRYCFICKSTKNLSSVPFDARIDVFSRRRLFISKGNRCCHSHMIKKRFYDDEIEKMKIYSNDLTVEISEVAAFIEKLFDFANLEVHDYIGKFKLSDERIKILTGYDWEKLKILTDMFSSLRNSKNRNSIQALVMFLYKLKSGNSNNLIGAALGVKESVVACFLTILAHKLKQENFLSLKQVRSLKSY